MPPTPHAADETQDYAVEEKGGESSRREGKGIGESSATAKRNLRSSKWKCDIATAMAHVDKTNDKKNNSTDLSHRMTEIQTN